MADMIDEVLQDLFAAGRMSHFGMELQPVQFSLSIFHRGEIATFGARGREKTFW